MRKTALVLITMAFLMAGCYANPRRAAMEIVSKDGVWKLLGVDRAGLELDGWTIYIYDTEVSDINLPPRLEKFILEIVNTDEVRPLYLEPGEIWLTRPDNRPIQLLTSASKMIPPGKSWQLVYDEGVRSQEMAYPFSMTITVFRGPNFKKPETVVIKLR